MMGMGWDEPMFDEEFVARHHRAIDLLSVAFLVLVIVGLVVAAILVAF